MTAWSVPIDDAAGVRPVPAQDGGRLVAQALGEVPDWAADGELVSDHIVLGYN